MQKGSSAPPNPFNSNLTSEQHFGGSYDGQT
jgi:hypothetical protein